MSTLSEATGARNENGGGVVTEPSETTLSLRDQVRRVHQLRRGLETGKAAVQEAKRTWEAEHAGLIAQVAAYQQDLAAAEDALRRDAVAVYSATGSKHPTPGVAIREVRRVVYEPEAAFAWAKAHDFALQLDVKQFEKLAVVGGIDCAAVVSEATATIDRDLAKLSEAD